MLSGDENNVDSSDCDDDERVVYKQKKPTLTGKTRDGPPAISPTKVKKMPPIYIEGELASTVDSLLCKHGIQSFMKLTTQVAKFVLDTYF